jgi:hypothetical protein
MRVSPTLVSIVIAGLAFILVPYCPTWLLNFLAGTRIGTAAMLLLVLAVIQFEVVISLAISLAVASVFIEHRRRILKSIHHSLPEKPVETRPIPPMPSAEPPIIEEVAEERVEREPAESEPVEREPLDTIDAHSEAIAKLMEENGFASLSS